MELLMIYLGWLAVLLFGAGAGFKIYRLAAMPLHLRWELYPVAHEPRPSGGSYMEEVDYVKKPRHVVLLGELRELLSEVFILKRVYRPADEKTTWGWAKIPILRFEYSRCEAITPAKTGIYPRLRTCPAGGNGYFHSSPSLYRTNVHNYFMPLMKICQ